MRRTIHRRYPSFFSQVPLASVVASALVGAAFVALAFHNLGLQDLWWDESAQFWISQGLSNYAPPFSNRQSAVDVFRLNISENLDPGGYSLLLHFWTMRSTAVEVVRSLSFCFLMLTALAFGALGWMLSRNALLAVCSSSVLFLYSLTLYYGFEIRAYSMEAAGVAVCALGLVHGLKKPSPRRMFFWGSIAAVFLTSRYAFSLISLAILSSLAVSLCRTNDRLGRKLKLLAAFCFPQAVCGAVLAQLVLRPQIFPEMLVGKLGLTVPSYAKSSLLFSAPSLQDLLRDNLISLPATPITLALLAFFFFRPRLYASLHQEKEASSLAQVDERFRPLYGFILAIQLISLFVSALGYYPWNIVTRWSAYLFPVSAIALITMTCEIFTLHCGSSQSRARVAIAHFFAFAFLIFAIERASAFRQENPGGFVPKLQAQVANVPWRSLSDEKVFVTWREVPGIRYLYEHGPYRGRAEYPARYRFETFEEHMSKRAIDLERERIAALIYNVGSKNAGERFGTFPVPVWDEQLRALASR